MDRPEENPMKNHQPDALVARRFWNSQQAREGQVTHFVHGGLFKGAHRSQIALVDANSRLP
jgi:hypothetical protein